MLVFKQEMFHSSEMHSPHLSSGALLGGGGLECSVAGGGPPVSGGLEEGPSWVREDAHPLLWLQEGSLQNVWTKLNVFKNALH